MSSLHNTPHLTLLGSAQHDIFNALCVHNRRRRSAYLVVVALSIALLVFAKEYFPPEQFFGSSAPTSAIDITTPNSEKHNLTDGQPPLPTATVEPVIFTLIMWSEDSALEGAILIKSIILYNTKPSDIHIICDDEAEEVLRSRLTLIQNPPRHIRVWFYKPSWQSMLDRVKREGSIATDHSAGLPGLMKLFIHEIIPPTVKKGIYIDTDAIFITDPSLLWNVFDTLRPETAFVMGSHPDQVAPEWNDASRICSCIMLLDLDKLRSLRLMDSSVYRALDDFPALSPVAFRAKYGEPSGEHGRYDNVRLGDQGYWWAIVDYRPDLFEPLSYDYEVTTCLLDTYSTGLGDDIITEDEEISRQSHVKGTPQEGHIILPKILHFNCLHGHVLYYEWPGWSNPNDGLTIRWGSAVAYHKGYKWIWFNQGQKHNSEHTLEMFTIANIKFADEIVEK
ncbi:hypothetical protein CVT25_012296 [Psilocybe cyanescens]|uniref:Glycosyltransferase family 8 protein n=1 Tax=Psilocybe cyanescens TaxID=93625 RepID=A0A409XH87_PSICY|nr:hypothetical protein CVT25_012296 [Psilocybe cyanescens]